MPASPIRWLKNVTTETTYTVTVTNQDGCPSAASHPCNGIIEPGSYPVIDEVTADRTRYAPAIDVQLGVSVGGALSYCNSNFSNVTYEHVTNVTYAGHQQYCGWHRGSSGLHQPGGQCYGGHPERSVGLDPSRRQQEVIAAWIDWNQNGILGDAGGGRRLATFTSSPGPFTMSVTPPAGAVNRNTRMRVQPSP
ncbi:MAG: GEVED domain-containing protein [Flavobacteriales bacterium]